MSLDTKELIWNDYNFQFIEPLVVQNDRRETRFYVVRKDNDPFLWPLPWLSLLPTADNTLPKGAPDQRTKNIGD